MSNDISVKTKIKNEPCHIVNSLTPNDSNESISQEHDVSGESSELSSIESDSDSDSPPTPSISKSSSSKKSSKDNDNLIDNLSKLNETYEQFSRNYEDNYNKIINNYNVNQRKSKIKIALLNKKINEYGLFDEFKNLTKKRRIYLFFCLTRIERSNY
jgi:hypothetical protein